MLTLLQHAVKHFTPLWQRNLSLLFAVSFTGTTLSLFLLLPNSNSSMSQSLFPSADKLFLSIFYLLSSALPHPALDLFMLPNEAADAFMVRPEDDLEPVQGL